ncbi:MAG TPA: PQQ-dependent sugar dehydrogenase, partial [Nitrospiria bacterium]|nr:PQQ-dependent sugar dehydrogenase [Nitrospiria bacterium]
MPGASVITGLLFLILFVASPVRAEFSARPVAIDLKFPVAIAFSPDHRLFFSERFSGNIRVIENPLSDSPRLVPDPVFTFGPVSTFFERGLLGIVLDPGFDKNGFLYAFYSHKGSGIKTDRYRHRLMRITIKKNKGTDPVALLDRLPIGSQSEFGRGNHNGGSVAFGPDGKLYVSIGDLAKPKNAQDLGTFAGKMLRINPDGSAPPDNPFYNRKKPDSPRSYVFALGLRNSFDFTF